MGEDPDGNSIDADSNNDGFVSIEEAFIYAENNGSFTIIGQTPYETPQYDATKDYLGENLTLLGSELCIVGNIHDETFISDATYERCSFDIEDVSIENNSDVIIRALEEVVIQGNFEAGAPYHSSEFYQIVRELS